MSRGTRLKCMKNRRKVTTNHHQSYSQSDNYFPQEFSKIGKPLVTPSNISPFVENNTIHFFGAIAEFQRQSNIQICHKDQIKTINIFMEGELIRKYNPFIANCIFVSGMMCFFPFYALESSCLRQNFFTKYVFNQYNHLLTLINQYPNLTTLILTIQDNMFDQAKAQMMEEMLLKSSISKIIIRNHCYYMKCNCKDFNNLFLKIRQDLSKSFKFIWEKKMIKSSKQKLQHQEAPLAYNMQ